MMILKVSEKQSFTLFSNSIFFEMYSWDKAWIFLKFLKETSVLFLPN